MRKLTPLLPVLGCVLRLSPFPAAGGTGAGPAGTLLGAPIALDDPARPAAAGGGASGRTDLRRPESRMLGHFAGHAGRLCGGR